MTFDQVLSWWSFVFLGVLIYLTGQWIKVGMRRLLARWPRALRLYEVTIDAHGAFAGALVAGYAPGFPIPSAIGESRASHLLFGFVAGACSSISFKMLTRALSERGLSLSPSGVSVTPNPTRRQPGQRRPQNPEGEA
jgi:hypothetical protein